MSESKNDGNPKEGIDTIKKYLEKIKLLYDEINVPMIRIRALAETTVTSATVAELSKKLINAKNLVIRV